MKKQYRHLFFDLDHTLWDFEQNSRAVLRILFDEHGLAELLPDCAYEDFESCYERHNERFWDRFRRGYISREELRWKRMWHTLLELKVQDLDLSHALSDRYLQQLPRQMLLMPHAAETLNYCVEKGYHLHLITNGYELVQWQKLRSSGLDHFFGQVITSENSKSMKPQREIFDFALKTTGARAHESIMIGDAIEADVLGAQMAGIDQVFYNFHKKEHAEKPTFEVHCLSELRQFL